MRTALGAVVAVIAVATCSASTAPVVRGAARPAVFAPTFAESGLVTDEFSTRHPERPGGRLSPEWIATSGSLFARDGAGWTGDLEPTANSAVFRLVSRRRDFTDVRVSFELRVARQSQDDKHPAQAYDGVHVWVRYADPDRLYAVSVMRRDGGVAIKRKDGTYQTLAQGKATLGPGEWVPVEVEARGSTITLRVGGRRVLEAEDGALSGPGGVGVRGDNTEFEFRRFRAEPLGAR